MSDNVLENPWMAEDKTEEFDAETPEPDHPVPTVTDIDDPWAELADHVDLLERIAGDGGPWSQEAGVLLNELDERGYLDETPTAEGESARDAEIERLEQRLAELRDKDEP